MGYRYKPSWLCQCKEIPGWQRAPSMNLKAPQDIKANKRWLHTKQPGHTNKYAHYSFPMDIKAWKDVPDCRGKATVWPNRSLLHFLTASFASHQVITLIHMQINKCKHLCSGSQHLICTQSTVLQNTQKLNRTNALILQSPISAFPE